MNARTAYKIAYRLVRCKTQEYSRIPRYSTFYYAAAEKAYRDHLLALGFMVGTTCQTERQFTQDRRDESLSLVWAQCEGCACQRTKICKPHCQILDLGYLLESALPRSS